LQQAERNLLNVFGEIHDTSLRRHRLNGEEMVLTRQRRVLSHCRKYVKTKHGKCSANAQMLDATLEQLSPGFSGDKRS
jgi:hypothetical protein